MGIAILFIVFGVLLVLGVPVAFSLAAAALATLWYLDLPAVVLVQQIGAGIGTASLVAIPLFIFAGEIMMRGGISGRLVAFAASVSPKSSAAKTTRPNPPLTLSRNSSLITRIRSAPTPSPLRSRPRTEPSPPAMPSRLQQIFKSSSRAEPSDRRE